MKLSEIRKAYEVISGKLSDVNRQLAFAGIGIIWIFKISNDGGTTIPNELLDPILLLVLSLGFDLMQYIFQTIIWYGYYIIKKKENSDEEREVNEPEWFNIICWALFGLKVISLITAYGLLFSYLWKQLFN